MAKRDNWVTEHITLKDARIVYKNFKGRAGRFNKEGERSFCVVLEDDELAKKLDSDGWNVRWPKEPENEYGERLFPILPVDVGFVTKKGEPSPFPPRIKMVQEGGEGVWLDQTTVGILDEAVILHATLVVRPYNWENDAGENRVKAYLKDLKVEIEKDIFCD